MTYSELLADFAIGLDFSALPAEVQQKVKNVLATTVGLGLASSHYPQADAFAQLAARGRSEESLLLGRAALAPAPLAAAFHATVAHGLEFDDTHSSGPLHAGTVVVPVCVAVAQACAASGGAVLAGVTAGLEVHCRLGITAAGQFWKRGFYSTAVLGAPAGALGASRILGLSAPTATRAFGLAASFSGLTHESMLGAHYSAKHAAVGWAAQGAVTAAFLAQAGISGAPTVIEGKYGIYEAFVGSGLYDLDRLAAGLGTRWHLLEISPKQYPVCHHGQPFIEATLQLRSRGIEPQAVQRITCVTTEPTARWMWLPPESQRPPATPTEAKFNLRYLIASALVRGRVGLDSFKADQMADPSVWEITRKMAFAVDDSLSFAKFPAEVTVELSDGRRESCRITATRGTKDNPETTAEMRQKFEQCASPVIGAQRAEQLWQALMSLEAIKDVRELWPLMRP